MAQMLSLNIDKTNFTIFHPCNKPSKDHITIKINKKAIVEKQFIKYFGVIIIHTSKLVMPNIQHIQKDFRSHCNYVQFETLTTYKCNEKCLL